MDIDNTLELLNTLLSQTDKKSEQKVYSCFIGTVTSLKDKELSDNQLRLTQEKLSGLDLDKTPENRKKFYKQKHDEFKGFLKKEFSFTSEKYYTEIWMVYGMTWGVGLGLSVGVAINPAIGTSIGLSIGIGVGMAVGLMYGAKKDAEAKKLGRVI